MREALICLGGPIADKNDVALSYKRNLSLLSRY